MKKIWKKNYILAPFFMTSIFPLVLSSCASHLNQQQCASMNWHDVGFNDAANGQAPRNLNPAINDCAKFNLTVNTKAYQQGWQQGARQYCQPNNAYTLGTQGQGYAAICPADLSSAFEKAWRKGLRTYCTPETGYALGRQGKNYPDFCAADLAGAFKNAYDQGRRLFDAISDLSHDIDDVNRQINQLQGQIDNNRNQINSVNQQLSNPNLMPGQRASLTVQAHDLSHSNDELQKQIGRLQDQRTRLLQQQRDYETR